MAFVEQHWIQILVWIPILVAALSWSERVWTDNAHIGIDTPALHKSGGLF